MAFEQQHNLDTQSNVLDKGMKMPFFRLNPFARKSRGILGVIKAQTKKNRVV